MLNAAIVGLGWWGKELVKSVAESTLLRFSRGVTLEPTLVSEFAAEHRIAIGDSYTDVLKDRTIDAVVLATPHTQHRAQVEAAASATKHVFCEKPFALALADAEAAMAACRRAGVALGVGQNRRLWPSIQMLRKMNNSDEFGKIVHIEGNYSHDWLAALPADNWRNALLESRAGGMTGMGVHLLDCFSYINGRMSRISAVSTNHTLGLPAGDTTSAQIEFANRSTGTLLTTLKSPYVWRLAVYGTKAWAESISERRVVMHRSSNDPEIIDLPARNHIRENLESFAVAALHNQSFHIDDASILHTVAALEGVFLSSAERGTWIHLDQEPLSKAA